MDVGALGPVNLEPGAFVYVGSAFGPGGLAARLRRHVQQEKASLHWHIDYLRAALSLEGAWISTDDAQHECAWTNVVADQASTRTPLPGAGASDCSCSAHFFRLGDTEDTVQALTASAPGDQESEIVLLKSRSLTSMFAAHAISLSYVSVANLRKHLVS